VSLYSSLTDVEGSQSHIENRRRRRRRGKARRGRGRR